MKNNTKFSYIFILPCLISLLGCNKEKGVLCIDGTSNHEYVFHEKEEFDELEGHNDYYSCSKCNKYFDINKKYIEDIPTISPIRKIIIPEKFNGEVISTLSDTVLDYLQLNNESDIASYLYTNQNNYTCATKGIYLGWQCLGEDSTYSVEFSTNEEFSSIEKTIKNVVNTYTTVYNLLPGKHYYRIVDSSSNYSVTDCFEIASEVRTINVTSSNTMNLRDLGGWSISNGDKVKYGMLYRSALPSSSDLSLFYWDLGIKTEIDLRIKGGQNDEIKDFTGVNSQLIKYEHPVPELAQYWPQYDEIFKSNYKEYTKAYFQSVFNILSNKDNYPILFHCKSGADRTGTLAYIINGLAGVSYEDLTKDYELTSFYRSPRWRSDIEVNGNNYSFSNQGYMKETGRWGIFHKTMCSTYGDGKTLPQTILNFLTSYCEVSEELIKQTLSIIMDGENYLNLFN